MPGKYSRASPGSYATGTVAPTRWLSRSARTVTSCFSQCFGSHARRGTSGSLTSASCPLIGTGSSGMASWIQWSSMKESSVVARQYDALRGALIVSTVVGFLGSLIPL